MIRTGASGTVGTGRFVTVALVVLLALAVPGAALAASDPYRPQQWHLDRIGAPVAWDVTGGNGQVIAIVDSGVDLDHPDLKDRFVRRGDGTVMGRDFVDEDGVPNDAHGHGTMVAGVVASSLGNGIGGVGVAPGARLLPVRVLDAKGRGTQSDVEDGIRWAVDNGATVVNLSLESAIDAAGALPLGLTAPVDAVRYAWERGVVVVAAAGNSGSPFTDYPRSSPVVLVGATDHDDERASFSDSGRDDVVMAPGVDIVSTWCREDGDDACSEGTHTYGKAKGTSFSAPQVAGGVALLRATGMTGSQAVDRVRATARDLGRPGPDSDTGVGLLDLVRALNAARAAGTTTTQPTLAPITPPEETSTPEPPPPTTQPPRPAASAQPTATAAPPTATPTPTEPAPSPSSEAPIADTFVTAPPTEAPIAAEPLATGVRSAWALVAALLVAGTGVLVTRVLVDQR